MELLEARARQAATSPLLLEGFCEYNRLKFGLQPQRVALTGGASDLPALQTVLYLDKKGRILQPPSNPYQPLEFRTTDTKAPHRLSSQWFSVAEPLVEEMRERGMHNTLLLTPAVTDVRPWQWAGFKVGVRYTYCLEFPYGLHQADGMVRSRIRKAAKAGFVCERTARFDHLLACLAGTEARAGFQHQVSERDLEMLMSLLGDEHVRVYICYAPDGEPAAGSLVLHQAGGTAIGWLIGTVSDHLKAGATQLLIDFMLADIQQAGAAGFDFFGANLPGVADSKSYWGPELTPYYTVESHGLKTLAKAMRDWFRAAKK